MEGRGYFMEDPEILIIALKEGRIRFAEAKMLIGNLIEEIVKHGMWEIESLGYEKAEDLWELLPSNDT